MNKSVLPSAQQFYCSFFQEREGERKRESTVWNVTPCTSSFDLYIWCPKKMSMIATVEDNNYLINHVSSSSSRIKTTGLWNCAILAKFL